MKYYIDTEFIEGFKKPLFGKRRHFIDLISIGIVADDGREYYAISNEFNYKDADEWVKKNVIFPILKEEVENYNVKAKTSPNEYNKTLDLDITAITVIQKVIGKTNKQIANEIRYFIFPSREECGVESFAEYQKIYGSGNIDFYGYYADYDWVLFCSLYGRMIDLPKGFPMYCRDLQQMKDELIKKIMVVGGKGYGFESTPTYEQVNQYLTPTQVNEHNALADARWNKRLYQFISQIKQHNTGYESCGEYLDKEI